MKHDEGWPSGMPSPYGVEGGEKLLIDENLDLWCSEFLRFWALDVDIPVLQADYEAGSDEQPGPSVEVEQAVSNDGKASIESLASTTQPQASGSATVGVTELAEEEKAEQ